MQYILEDPNANPYLKLKAADNRFGAETFILEYGSLFAAFMLYISNDSTGLPEVLDRKALEQMFQDVPPKLDTREGNNVTKLFKDAVKKIADPLYLPARQDLYPPPPFFFLVDLTCCIYPIWPWMDPAWTPAYGVKGAPPPQFYPATWYYYIENAGRPMVELWTQEYAPEN